MFPLSWEFGGTFSLRTQWRINTVPKPNNSDIIISSRAKRAAASKLQITQLSKLFPQKPPPLQSSTQSISRLKPKLHPSNFLKLTPPKTLELSPKTPWISNWDPNPIPSQWSRSLSSPLSSALASSSAISLKRAGG